MVATHECDMIQIEACFVVLFLRYLFPGVLCSQLSQVSLRRPLVRRTWIARAGERTLSRVLVSCQIGMPEVVVCQIVAGFKTAAGWGDTEACSARGRYCAGTT